MADDQPRRSWSNAEVQVPDGGTWKTIYTYRYASGEPARAAWWVVRYGYVQDTVGSRRRRDALAELPAEARVVLFPDSFSPHMEPVTVTVRDAFLAVLGAKAAERRTALAAAKAVADAARQARTTARVAGYDLEAAIGETVALGVPDVDIRKATTAPRKPAKRRATQKERRDLG